MKPIRLPPPAYRLARSPQLAPLAILEAALGPCEAALLAAHDELARYTTGRARSSEAARATSLMHASRRLGIALAAYQEALDRAERRRLREVERDIPF